jgi:hypothetical protein
MENYTDRGRDAMSGSYVTILAEERDALVARAEGAEAALTVAVREVSETARKLGESQAETDTLKRRIAEWARNAALLETEATELRSIIGEKNS